MTTKKVMHEHMKTEAKLIGNTTLKLFRLRKYLHETLLDFSESSRASPTCEEIRRIVTKKRAINTFLVIISIH